MTPRVPEDRHERRMLLKTLLADARGEAAMQQARIAQAQEIIEAVNREYDELKLHVVGIANRLDTGSRRFEQAKDAADTAVESLRELAQGKPPLVLTDRELLALRAYVMGDAFDVRDIDSAMKKIEPVYDNQFKEEVSDVANGD